MSTQTNQQNQIARTLPSPTILLAICTVVAMSVVLSGCSEVRSGRGVSEADQTFIEPAEASDSAGFAMSGVVTKVTSDVLTLKDQNMAEYTVLIDDGTMVTLDGNEALVGSLEVGHYANVIVNDDSAEQMTARAVDAVSTSDK